MFTSQVPSRRRRGFQLEDRSQELPGFVNGVGGASHFKIVNIDYKEEAEALVPEGGGPLVYAGEALREQVFFAMLFPVCSSFRVSVEGSQ